MKDSLSGLPMGLWAMGSLSGDHVSSHDNRAQVGYSKDGRDKAVLPHKHGGSNTTDVMCPNLKLETGRVRDGSTSCFYGIPEEEDHFDMSLGRYLTVRKRFLGFIAEAVQCR
ncbi:hypothetical protein E2C01_052726 [Portunus trituberculatus]|uniref:Uncharacterized protein n=1 Tax=Portunus trituberculatus TaxID=210409 RepID=A0A5B7GP13_PORTR|nr:hypothetical protein [Portunus trituberculatus]